MNADATLHVCGHPQLSLDEQYALNWYIAGVPEYYYLGDRLTDPALRGMTCRAVRRANGRCIRGRNGNMKVVDGLGRHHVVLGRRLRKLHGFKRKELQP